MADWARKVLTPGARLIQRVLPKDAPRGETPRDVRPKDSADAAFEPAAPVTFSLANGIKVQFGQIEGRGCARTETYCPGDGFECSTTCVDEYTEFVEQANWFFNNCN